MEGIRPDGKTIPSPVFAKGRICERAGCGTRLSLYNSSRFCWQHAEVTFPLYRGKKVTSTRAG